MDPSVHPKKCNLYRLFCRDRLENPMPEEKAQQLREMLWHLLQTHPPHSSSQGGTS